MTERVEVSKGPRWDRAKDAWKKGQAFPPKQSGVDRAAARLEARVGPRPDGSPGDFERRTHTTKGIFADTHYEYAAPKSGLKGKAKVRAKLKSGTIPGTSVAPFASAHKRTVKWKPERLVPALAAGGLAAGYVGHKMYSKKKKQPPPQPVQISDQPVRVQNVDKAVKPRSMEDYDKDVSFRDRRFDSIEARGMMIPKPSAMGGYASEVVAGEPVSAVVGGTTDALKSRGSSRGHVVAQTKEGAGPGGIGRHFGYRKRSMIKPGHARSGEEDLPFKVVRRSKKDRDKERRDMTVKPAVLGAAGAGAALSLQHPSVKRGLKRVGDKAKREFGPGSYPAKEVKKIPKPMKDAVRNVAGRVTDTAKLVYRNPRKAAAVAAVAGTAGAIYGNKRKPDTHEIKFVHPKSKGKAKEKSPKR